LLPAAPYPSHLTELRGGRFFTSLVNFHHSSRPGKCPVLYTKKAANATNVNGFVKLKVMAKLGFTDEDFNYFKQPLSLKNDDQAFSVWFNDLSARINDFDNRQPKGSRIIPLKKNDVRHLFDQQLTTVQAYNLLTGNDF